MSTVKKKKSKKITQLHKQPCKNKISSMNIIIFKVLSIQLNQNTYGCHH